MKVLVTGGSGFIGSHLVEKLRAAGHKVDILDVRKPVDSSLITKWINKDIRENLDDVISGYDAVYHLAAVANARACGQFPRKAYDVAIQSAVILDYLSVGGWFTPLERAIEQGDWVLANHWVFRGISETHIVSSELIHLEPDSTIKPE